MTRGSNNLTKNEQEIMEVLWRENRALSRSEIIDLSEDRSWKASSIHILLNQLIEKEAIKVSGFVKTGKNYGRIYAPMYSEEEYYARQFKDSRSYQQEKAASIVNFVSAFISNEEIDEQTIDNLEKLLEKKRKELK